jgi:hypothetical protein
MLLSNKLSSTDQFGTKIHQGQTYSKSQIITLTDQNLSFSTHEKSKWALEILENLIVKLVITKLQRQLLSH